MRFDVANAKSFEKVLQYHEQIKRMQEDEAVPMVLAGNKFDLPTRSTDMEQAQDMANSYRIPFMKTSAKTRKGVNDTFYYLVRVLRTKRERRSQNLNPHPGSNSGGCCQISCVLL